MIVKLTSLFLAVFLFALPLQAQSIEALSEDTASTAEAQPAEGSEAVEPEEAEPVAQPKEVEPPKRTPRVGYLTLSGPLRDGPLPYAWVNESDASPSLQMVLQQIKHVGTNDRYLGIVVFMDDPELSLTQTLAIAQALTALRDQQPNREVVVFADRYDMRSYLVASAADRVLLQRKGQVELTGLGMEEMYLAATLAKVGVEADFVQVGDYKGAAEPLTRTEPSKEWSENIDGVLDSMWATIEARIAKGRALNADELDKAMNQAWVMTDEQLKEAGLVDDLVERDLMDAAEGSFGNDFEYDEKMGVQDGPAMPTNPFALMGTLLNPKVEKTRGPTIAVIHMRGPIVTGESTIEGGPFSSESIGSQSVLDAITEARDDDNIKGVILRIDSPGGSARASELIWQAVRELNEVKPVYASVGSMAASGGYYIVCATQQIFAQDGSIVGSIGVVGGKLVMKDLFDRIGLQVHQRTRGPNAALFSSTEKFTDEQRAMVKQSMETVYAQFLDRIRIGRGTRVENLNDLAQGRIFTGVQAMENGLIDEIGGLAMTEAALAKQLGLTEGSYNIFNLPRKMDLGTYLEGVLGASGPANTPASVLPQITAALQPAKLLLGPAAHQALTRQAVALWQLQREPVLTLMPAAIVVE